MINIENLSEGCKLACTINQDTPEVVLINAEPGRYSLEEIKQAIKEAEEFVKKEEVKVSEVTSTEGIPGDYINLP